MRDARWTLLAVPLLVAPACSPSPNTSGSTNVVCQPITTTVSHRARGFGGTVFTIVMENHSRGQILGDDEAPFINALARSNAVANGYHDAYVHPSEPNYLWMVAGENFGILNDKDPGPGNVIDSRSHIADQLELAGLTWKAYAESMGRPCGLSSHGIYAAKHVPFLFFADVNGWRGKGFDSSPRCNDHVVDYAELDADLAAGTVPDYVFITPNLAHDMHDGTIADGDAWLSREVPKITASSAFQHGGVLFLLWDEGTNDTDDPAFIVVSPNAKHSYVSQTPYDTSSYLNTVQAIFGLDALPCAAHPSAIEPMNDLFGSADGGVAL
jgi:hypothetical protein